LKETNDECNLALQALLLKYAVQFEETLLDDAFQLSPIGDNGIVLIGCFFFIHLAAGLKKALCSIDNDHDFQEFFSQLLSTAKKIDATHDEPQPMRVFGVPLDVIVEREKSHIPLVILKCIEAVEEYGLDAVGIYRTAGNSNQIQKMKAFFDMDCRKVNLHDVEFRSDVHSIAALLKAYLRELPEPLLPRDLYQDFINAASKCSSFLVYNILVLGIESPKHRLHRVHELVNILPDVN
jgi:hypothetical protein